jgi:hypothetical protein
VAVAMGNSGNRQFLPALRRMAGSPDVVVGEHAAWAIERLAALPLEANRYAARQTGPAE